MDVTESTERAAEEVDAVRGFERLSRADVELAGGKGANLGELMAAGLPVPPGFVIGAPAYAAFCDGSGLRERIGERLAAVDVEDTAELERAAEEVRRMVESEPLPGRLEHEVAAAYERLAGEQRDAAVAVRSSATAEDTESASFAGMNETLLNVRGPDAVLDAVRRCWSSLFGARTVYYRAKRGFGQADMDIAVVVQRQIEATRAGAMWVADTQDNRIEKWAPAPSTTSYAYDQAGNLTAVEREEAGEIPAIEEAYAYDGTGLRASQTVSGTTSHLTWNTSGGLPLLLDDGHASYIYGPQGLPIEQISEETPTIYHHDQLGSTRMLTNESGEATATFTYSAYGQPAGSTGTQTTPLGFAGQLTNEQSGLQYLRARVYDPVTGQFLTRDSIEALTREPYSYAGVNPLNYTDPSGLTNWNPLSTEFWTEGNFISDTLSPIPYYEKEVEEWENGASYWDSVKHGLLGACVFASDATGLGALGRGLLGRSGAALAEDAVAGLTAGRTSGVYVVDSADDLGAIYSKLAAGGRPVTAPSTYPGKEVILRDGTRVGIRGTSKTGGPAVDIKPPDQSKITIHVK
jgi:RHS repeat-associated protein